MKDLKTSRNYTSILFFFKIQMKKNALKQKRTPSFHPFPIYYGVIHALLPLDAHNYATCQPVNACSISSRPESRNRNCTP